jgi:glycosyltransferase involved in cell wall biosynthesis
MNNKVSIIIPFLNEEENILFLTESLNNFFATKKAYKSEIIFVNDGSTDNSVALLQQQSHTHYDCKIISLSKNFGSHAALRAGIRHASGSHICFMYADLQDPLNLIDRLFDESKKGNEICWANRNTTENSFFERSFSKTYSYLMKKYAISSYPEKGFDIVLFSNKVQQHINQNIEANSSIFLQILTLGFKQSFISYEKEARKKGKSKWTFSKKIKLFIDSFVAFSYAPIRFVTLIGIFLFIIGFLSSAYLISRRLIYNDLESGWPALVSILMIGFGITNISLGILAEYLWRTLDSSRKRPVFIIDEIIDIKNEK